MIDLHGRAIRSRIERWREAGLIDATTAERLIAFETTDRPGGIPTLAVIGAFSVALGIIAVVSANWDQIPVWAKLGGHVALNLALGAGLFLGLTAGRLGHRARETLLMVLSASTLALLGHVGQSFQLQGDTFGLMASWLALASPFTIAFARGTANRWLWTLGLFATAGAGLSEHAEWLERTGLVGTAIALILVVGYAAPLAMRGTDALETWGRHLNHAMLGALVAVTSLAQTAWRLDALPDDWPMRLDVLTGAAVAMAGLLATHVAFGRGAFARGALARGVPGRPWFTAFVVLSPAYASLPLAVGGADSAVLSALGFCLYWLAVAQLAHAANRPNLYRFGVVVIAMRIFLVFVEAFGGLLLTGVGLIASGLLLLAFAYAVRRLLKGAVRP